MTSSHAVALNDFVAVWSSSTSVAPALSCAELDALLALFGAAGRREAAASWIGAHAESGDCEGHDAPATPALAPAVHASGVYCPPPGTEFPFSVSDVVRAVARLLGKGWTVETGSWGLDGNVVSPCGAVFKIYVDHEGDLIAECPSHDVPEDLDLPDGFLGCDDGIYLELATYSDGLDYLAGRYADAIRAVIGD
ncbi:hypothetical protein [Streptomyces sp. NPDC085659]|uniref:hypothetical protein n=1 Tax=Streptomyces sp. NPDC085659 TaxID=3155177 RepID=UPI00344C3D6C